MRIAMGHVLSLVDVIRALQEIERQLSVDIHWVGVVKGSDPDPVSPGDLWLRVDLLELRIHTKDADDVLKTYSVAVTEVVPQEV